MGLPRRGSISITHPADLLRGAAQVGTINRGAVRHQARHPPTQHAV